MTQNQPKSPPGLQKVWRQVQPIFKTQSLRAVRATIQVLEGVADNLEKMPEPAQVELSQPSQQPNLEGKAAPVKPPAKPADSPTVALAVPVVLADQTAVEPGEVAATSPAVKPGEEAQLDDDIWGADESLSLDEPDKPAGDQAPTAEAIAPPPASPQPAKRIETPLPAAGTLWAKWISLLDWVRDRLPDSLSDRLSDSVLTSIAGGVLVLLVWITSSLLPNQAEQVAQTPSVNPSPVRPSPVRPTPVRPAPEQTAPAPPPAPTKAPEIKQPTVTRSPAPVPLPSPPHPLTSPPPLELTPEQSLIAAIQDQVTEVTNRYANGLIQAIQANFRDSRLIVKVSMGWYELSAIAKTNSLTKC
ncbi:MAG: hypothetical protein HC899_19675 [Leptolyngbyaceae cyanobacterium SM1_4_3]|nr:hypothetical protein [Leptolyngbyaceae cyanobacterium SM1_4_3]